MQVAVAVQRGHLTDVAGRQLRARRFDVAGRKCLAVAVGQLDAVLFAMQLDQPIAQLVVPVTHDVHQFGFEQGRIHDHALALARTDQQMKLRQWRLADLHRGI